MDVEESVLLDEVEDDEGEQGDGEQDWHTEAVHHGDVSDGKDGRVLEVHEVDGSLPKVDVALDGGDFGVGALLGLTRLPVRMLLGERLPADAAAAIEQSEEESQASVSKDLNQGVVDVEDHSGDDNITDALEPGRVEVGHGACGEPEVDRLLGHVRVDHEQEESRVEVLHNEGHSGGLGEALSFSGVANPVNHHDADGSQDVVDTDKEIGESGGPVVDTGGVGDVLFANGFIIGLTVRVFKIVVWVFLLLLLAEALEAAA